MLIAKFLGCLADLLFGRRKRLIFVKIKTEGLEVRGKIKMVRFEFNQAVTFTATPVDRRGNPAAIEAGTAEWSFVGMNAAGEDVSESVTIVVNPENELEATLTSGDEELTGVFTLRADGDPDAEEEAFIVATADVIVDAGNAVALSLTNTEPVDV